MSAILPSKLRGQSEVEAGIRQAIADSYAFARENLADNQSDNSALGSLAFWSSGGLLQEVSQEDTPEQYEFFNMFPKHIQVIVLGENSGVAQFYVEGSYKPAGGDPVPHYLTRATHVYVLEDGAWKVRAAHFSPVLGGSGTHITAIK